MNSSEAYAITIRAWNEYLADAPEHEQLEFERTLQEIANAAKNRQASLSVSDLAASTVERMRRLGYTVTTNPGGATIAW